MALAAPIAAAESAVWVADVACIAPPDVDEGSVRGEFVEIANAHASLPQDMTGWSLRTSIASYMFPEGLFIPPLGRTTVHTEAGDDTGVDLFWDRDTEALPDDLEGRVVLVAPWGDEVDASCGAFAFGCPDVAATGYSAGSVRLALSLPNATPETWRIYRADDVDEPFRQVAAISGFLAAFTDGIAPQRSMLRYIVIAEFADSRGQGCPLVTVSSVPDFPVGAATAAALAGVAGAYTLAKRLGRRR